MSARRHHRKSGLVEVGDLSITRVVPDSSFLAGLWDQHLVKVLAETEADELRRGFYVYESIVPSKATTQRVNDQLMATFD